MYLELKDVHSQLLEQHEVTVSQNESMKHSIIALERALADTRAQTQANADSSQIEALALANIKLKEELQRRCKEVQDLLVARNLPRCALLDDNHVHNALDLSNRGALLQLQDVSARNEDLAKQLEYTRLQLAQERRRRELAEENLALLRSGAQSSACYPTSGAGLPVPPNGAGCARSYEPPPPFSPGHGINPSYDAHALPRYAEYPGSVGRRGRYGIEPRRPLG